MPRHDGGAASAPSAESVRRGGHDGARPVVQRSLDGVALASAALFGFVAVVALTASLMSPSVQEQARDTPMVLFAGMTLAVSLCDWLCLKGIRDHDRAMSLGAFACSVMLAVCGGAAASFMIRCTQPMTAGALFASCYVAVNMTLMMVLVADPTIGGAIVATFASSVPLMLICAVALIHTLHVRLLAGFVLTVAVCCLQMLPNIVMHVPDRYLVEWRTYMTRRWTVRGGIPEKSRVLTRADVHDDMQTFLARYSTGFTICMMLMLLTYAIVADSCAFDQPYDRIGFLTLSAALFLFLTLKPRQSGRPFERYLMRLGGVTVLLIWCMHMPHALPDWGASLAVGVHADRWRVGIDHGIRHARPAWRIPFARIVPHRRRTVLRLHDVHAAGDVLRRRRLGIHKGVMMTASTPITRFRPADAARQCEASFIDLGFVVACAGVAALISHDITVTAMIALEAVAVLAVGEGSRGITPGNMMLGLRTVRVEGMHDATAGVLPAGMGRILIKYCMLIASLLAAFVGLPIVMCSPLFSGNDLNQGWANRLASLASVDIRQPIVVQARAPRQRIAMADESNPSIPRTVARRPSSLPTVALPPHPKPAPAAPAVPAMPVPVAPAPHIIIFFEDGSKQSLDIPSTLVLGRRPAAQQPEDAVLAVPDHTGTVSRSHARLEITEDHLWITDLGSTNGTKVVNENGEETRLKARQRFPIHTRNRIFLGDMGCSIIMSTSRRKHARER